MAADEAGFRKTLAELKASLSIPTQLHSLTNHIPTATIHLAKWFENPFPAQLYAPDFRSNAMILGTLPDPTLGGIVQGVKASQIYALLGPMPVSNSS